MAPHCLCVKSSFCSLPKNTQHLPALPTQTPTTLSTCNYTQHQAPFMSFLLFFLLCLQCLSLPCRLTKSLLSGFGLAHLSQPFPRLPGGNDCSLLVIVVPKRTSIILSRPFYAICPLLLSVPPPPQPPLDCIEDSTCWRMSRYGKEKRVASVLVTLRLRGPSNPQMSLLSRQWATIHS